MTAASRRCRRAWAALRIVGIPYSFLSLILAISVALQLSTGLPLYGEADVVALVLADHNIALAGVLLAGGPVALATVGRFTRLSFLLAIAALACTIGLHTIDVLRNARMRDGDTLHLALLGGVIAAALLTLWFAVKAAAVPLGAGFPSVPAAGSEFEGQARSRRQGYRTVRWSRSWLLLPALAAFPVVWMGWGVAGMLMLVYGLGVPEELLSTSNDWTPTLEGMPRWMLALLVAHDVLRVPLASVVAYLLWRAAWRRVRLSAEEVVGAGGYQPLLFLRSFQDEDAKVKPKALLRWLLRLQPRLEEVLVNKVSRLGPAVAIGLPGERIPPLGALRTYYSDDTWQPAVLGWMSQAHMILVVGGTSAWALWELSHVLCHGLADRLILVIPPDAAPAARADRWRALCQAANGSHWHSDMVKATPGRLLVVVFERNGQLLVVRGSDQHQVDYEIAVQIATLQLARRSTH